MPLLWMRKPTAGATHHPQDPAVAAPSMAVLRFLRLRGPRTPGASLGFEGHMPAACGLGMVLVPPAPAPGRWQTATRTGQGFC